MLKAKITFDHSVLAIEDQILYFVLLHELIKHTLRSNLLHGWGSFRAAKSQKITLVSPMHVARLV